MTKTDFSDVNEILIGYYLNNEQWYDTNAQNVYYSKLGKLSPSDITRATEHAKIIASKFLEWANNKNYKNVKSIYWTARSDITSIVGVEVDQTKNPTDILVNFQSGPSEGWLGISAKSKKYDISVTFKNPGLVSIDKELGLSLYDESVNQVNQFIKKHGLPTNTSYSSLQTFLNKSDNKEIKKESEELGDEVLTNLRNTLYNKLIKMTKLDFLKFVEKNIMSSEELFPPYVIVVAKGDKFPFTATVTDPVTDSRVQLLKSMKYNIQVKDKFTINVLSESNNKIFSIRFKYKDKKLASNIKMIVE